MKGSKESIGAMLLLNSAVALNDQRILARNHWSKIPDVEQPHLRAVDKALGEAIGLLVKTVQPYVVEDEFSAHFAELLNRPEALS
jgi:hypothetical protein